MKRLGLAVVASLFAACIALPAQAAPHGSPPPAGSSARNVCGVPASGRARCHAKVVTRGGDSAAPLATTTFQFGYTPADLAGAYKLDTSRGAGQTIAIVDAYDHPAAVADVDVYRRQFGLSACVESTITAQGCTFGNGATIRKVDQRGGTSYPAPDVGWAQEISLDLDMASAICPSCNILLVEADSNSLNDLAAAVNRAAAMGANEISNSYGTSGEFSGQTSLDASYNHPGVAVTVSSGDDGYGRFGYPASSPKVIAVGGTSLTRSSTTRGWSESAWSGAGSGCSRYEPKQSWQTDTGCSKRTVADVAAVANPSTGVAVYHSYGSSGGANWLVFGGTSASAPLIGAMFALRNGTINGASSIYSHISSLTDVTSGSNGSTCPVNYYCHSVTGYDGPTGLGTPKGLGAMSN